MLLRVEDTGHPVKMYLFKAFALYAQMPYDNYFCVNFIIKALHNSVFLKNETHIKFISLKKALIWDKIYLLIEN